MPTENRSSNTDMAAQLSPCPHCGQQDAFVEQLDSDASVVICQGRIDEHSACLARGPVGVQQHECEGQPGHDQAVKEWNKRVSAAPHPEPIAWMVGTAIWWHKDGAERDSEERSEPMVPLGPCDSPSEIARVTAQFKEWQASHHRNYCKAADERDELRGQLDQARRLLHTASIRLANWLEPSDDPRNQIIAFLEGGAEPSTPPAPCPNRLCHIDYTAHPHRCGCLKGDEESQRIYDEHFRKASAEPSEPVTAEDKP
ncbi:Lar family restriction alleviation protein [Pseudomonas monteilii]|uniref:Lar family restriction alleviation protein n=1 Tax=Pseudomonas monteilii TaxID=76759 RepID=UPI0018E6D4CC|nr:Lar family restriction alleviation protein [Pseudomonas monteilii]MBI6917706.1 Lar family restriction alleviation protein [Pseudomonas monteilii]